jgi:hypothetical protein
MKSAVPRMAKRRKPAKSKRPRTAIIARAAQRAIAERIAECDECDGTGETEGQPCRACRYEFYR